MPLASLKTLKKIKIEVTMKKKLILHHHIKMIFLRLVLPGRLICFSVISSEYLAIFFPSFLTVFYICTRDIFTIFQSGFEPRLMRALLLNATSHQHFAMVFHTIDYKPNFMALWN